jgi:chloramphenicol O-acetyltransferase type B
MLNYLRIGYRLARMVYYSVLNRTNLVTPRVLFAGNPRQSRKNTVQYLGKDVYIGHACHFGANVIFGSKILLASNISFVGGDHRWDIVGTPIMDTGRDELKTIKICDDVWIGHGAVIMQGVELGEGCIIAASSVVTKSVEPYSIVAGNPAREIKKRFDPEQIAVHRAALDQCIADRITN